MSLSQFHILLLYMQDDDYRIFFINSYSAIARKVICEVCYSNNSYRLNKSDISYLKISRAFYILIHSGKPNSVG